MRKIRPKKQVLISSGMPSNFMLAVFFLPINCKSVEGLCHFRFSFDTGKEVYFNKNAPSRCATVK